MAGHRRIPRSWSPVPVPGCRGGGGLAGGGGGPGISARPAATMAHRAYCLGAMPYVTVNGLSLYYETYGSGWPLVLLHGGLLTIGSNFGPLLEPLAANRQVIAAEFQGHGRTVDNGRPLTMDALAGDVVALLDHLGIGRADLFGFSLGGLVAALVALSEPGRVGKLVIASADPHRPPGRESRLPGPDRLPTEADFQAMREAYEAVAPDPGRFSDLPARTEALVHTVAPWTEEQLRSLATPALLIFGDRDFSPLQDVVELYDLLPDARLAVLPSTTHMGVIQQPRELLALITAFLDEPVPGIG